MSPRIHPEIAHLAHPIADLKPYHRNPRQGDVGAISESLRINGQYRPVVGNRRTDEVLAGNHTLMAAQALGWSEIAVTWVDVDDVQAAKIVAVDNRANDLATYDDRALIDLLKGLPDLEGTLYDGDDLDALIAGLIEPLELAGEPDSVPDLPELKETRTTLGDLWILGPHRLLVGDSTDMAAVDRLMAGDRAYCMWTDPPYGVDYVGKTKDALTIQNDGAGGLPELLAGAFAVATSALREGAPVYIAHPPGELSLTFAAAIQAAGWSLRQQLVWVKDGFALGRSDYHYRHEPIWLAYTAGGEGRRGRGGSNWHGDNAQDTVFEVAKPNANKDHPTMKPLALIKGMLANSCPRGGVVYEPFGGSGSTLIAAQALGMQARVVELDARYADVIARRFQECTGVLPIHEETGAEVDFTSPLDRKPAA